MKYLDESTIKPPRGKSKKDAPIFIFAGYEDNMLGYCEDEPTFKEVLLKNASIDSENDNIDSCTSRTKLQEEKSKIENLNLTAFIHLNKGLDRRITQRYIFKPYTPEELYELLMLKIKEKKFKIDYIHNYTDEPTFKEMIINHFEDCKYQTEEKNGGFITLLITEIMKIQTDPEKLKNYIKFDRNWHEDKQFDYIYDEVILNAFEELKKRSGCSS